MSFSATDAAFEGFRVTRHHPLAVLAWVLVSLVSVLAMVLIATPILSPVTGDFQTYMAGGFGAKPSDPLAVALRTTQMSVMPVNLLLQAILLPAIYRAMSQSGGDQYGFLRLGRSELRILGVQVIIGLLTLIVSEGGALLANLALGSGMTPLVLLIKTAVMIIGLYVTVRTALIPPAAFAEGRIDLKAGWDATAGLFWSLLGMGIIAGFMAFVVMLLLVIVALPIWLGGMAGGAAAGPVAMIGVAGLLVILSVAIALTTVIVTAPFMVAYRDTRAAPQA